MKRLISLLLIVALLLSGCGVWTGGNYSHIVPYEDNSGGNGNPNATVSGYWGLYNALVDLVENGAEKGIIFVPQYNRERLEDDLAQAQEALLKNDPMAAYALDSIHCEIGMNSGKDAVAVNLTYLYDKKEILKITRAKNMAVGKTAITKALDNCADSVVLYIENYVSTDFVQMVEDYADKNPHIVMETPQVKVNTYPESGVARVVELKFTYQTSREVLRGYQKQVSRIFTSASLYVDADAAASDKISQLYSFMMQLEDYEFNTSITPAYSLLRHGRGDAKAFATVYAAMCREAGLNSYVVTGTRWGEAWYWNLVEDETGWHHVDIIRCSQEDGLVYRTDAEMAGYVWDYEAYPASVISEETVPTEPATEPEQPQE